jgi:YHS domain-containing protein
MNQFKNLFRLLPLLALFAAPAAMARDDAIFTSRLNNLAVSGYDTISYFEGDKPQKGSAEFTTEYMGATWRFVSEDHLQTFLDNPEKYAPQYGGYCAWAAAAGHTAKGDPKQWSLVEGKLYLNYSARIKKRWEKDMSELIHDADANWPDVVLEDD